MPLFGRPVVELADPGPTQVTAGRLEMLEEHMLISESAMAALTLLLTDNETDKKGCYEMLMVFRRRLDALHRATLEKMNALDPPPAE